MPEPMAELSRNVLEMWHAGDRSSIAEPLLQVLEVKPMEDPKGFRCRLTVSDGVCSYGKLTTSHQSADASKTLLEYDLLRFTNFTISELPGRGFVTIVVEWEVVGNPGHKIGEPIALGKQPGKPTGAGGGAQSMVQQQPHNTTALRPPANAGGLQRTPVTEKHGNGGYEPNMRRETYGGGATAPNFIAGFHPIASITPYQNKWKILAKCTNKGELKKFTRRGDNTESQLFNVEFLDKSGEIRATAFGQEAEKFYPMIQVGGVYTVEGGRVQGAKKQFSALKNDYEIVFSKDTKVDLYQGQDPMANEQEEKHWTFVKFKDLPQHMDNNADVIGIVTNLADLSSVTSKKTQQPIPKREMTLADDSGTAVTVTLWGEKAENFSLEGDEHPVVAIRAAGVREFGGVSLSCSWTSKLKINPDIPMAHDLKGWYVNGGYMQEATCLTQMRGGGGAAAGLSQLKLIDVAERQNMGRGAKPDYFEVKGTVHYLKSENCMYPSCPLSGADGRPCRKKLNDQGNQEYRCEKCQKSTQSFKTSILLSIEILDFTGTHWVTLFTEQAEQLLGVSADDLNNLKETSEEQYQRVFEETMFKTFIFRVGAREDTYNEQTRIRWNCYNVKSVDWPSYQKALNEQIAKVKNL